MRNDNGIIERKYVILPIAAVLVGLLMGMISAAFTKHYALPIMWGVMVVCLCTHQTLLLW